jgi:hypothetical protein
VTTTPEPDPYTTHAAQEDRLVQQYPVIFRDWRGDPQRTCMAWGLETPPGWWAVLDAVCAEITAAAAWVNRQHPDAGFCVVAEQVKEKFGTLRFYYRVEYRVEWAEDHPEAPGTIDRACEQIRGAVNLAERLTGRICNECGVPVDPGERDPEGWRWHTVCPGCAQALREGNAARTAKFLERRAERAQANTNPENFRKGSL